MAGPSLGLSAWRPGTADALERALSGDRAAAADPRVADLLPTATALRALPDLPGPDPEFVAALAARLATQAATQAAALAAASPAGATTGRRTASRPATPARRPSGRPVVLVVGRSVPRLAAGLVASLLVVAAVLGVGAQGSLPGQPLYPVKQVVDAVQVQLAGTDLDRGTVQLAQAADHVGEARRLVADGARPSADDVDTALRLAADRTRDGRTSFQAVPATDRGEALAAQSRFLEQVVPQLEDLRAVVPDGSLDSLTALRGLLVGLATQVRQELAACQGCAPPLQLASGFGDAGPGTRPGSATAGAGAGASGATGSAGSGVPAPGGGSVVPGAPGATALPTPGATNLPSLGLGNGTLGGGVQVPGVGAGSSGASVGGGGVGATLPGVTATVGVPTVTVGSGGVGVGGGGVTVGGSGTSTPGITLPLPGVTLGGSSGSPTLGVGGVPVVSSTCVLGICPP
ncbi:DUF5667 domain-containing protein [Lapillicoccus jejuensis]|uniref:DUF5667 domain-containing protein n=1 Tax=Lapillicoccus jejuensis TaxID=402171 RepID=A0A542DX91_9MICO|nr:DUF5667 domain-containing protein [Lapillicoccus jejuensis]TQJ07696.1 hypothetical protein FB458_0764 [Lapillicoccus jejuensis]